MKTPNLVFSLGVRGDRMKRFVEGQNRSQLILLPDCLDDYVGEDNPVRMSMPSSMNWIWRYWALRVLYRKRPAVPRTIQ